MGLRSAAATQLIRHHSGNRSSYLAQRRRTATLALAKNSKTGSDLQ